jgi:hypothetical protein
MLAYAISLALNSWDHAPQWDGAWNHSQVECSEHSDRPCSSNTDGSDERSCTTLTCAHIQAIRQALAAGDGGGCVLWCCVCALCQRSASVPAWSAVFFVFWDPDGSYAWVSAVYVLTFPPCLTCSQHEQCIQVCDHASNTTAAQLATTWASLIGTTPCSGCHTASNIGHPLNHGKVPRDFSVMR